MALKLLTRQSKLSSSLGEINWRPDRTTTITHFQNRINKKQHLKKKKKKKSYNPCQSGVVILGAFESLESCGAVQLCSLRRVSYLLHAYKQWGGRYFAGVVPPLSTQFISSNTLIHFLFWGNNWPPQDRFLAISWNALWMGGVLGFPSFL